MKRALICIIFLSVVYACTGSTPYYPDDNFATQPSDDDRDDASQGSDDRNDPADPDNDNAGGDTGSGDAGNGDAGGTTEPDESDESAKPAPSEPQLPAEGSLTADGNAEGTYDLILSRGYNLEAPDMYSVNHTGVQHITQSYDKKLKKYVFDFLIHAEEDSDRDKTSVTDRQRNEIKTDGHSPASMIGQEGEQMIFRWKFCLPAGMKTINKFCHIHQIKGLDNKEGTADVGNPVITYTLRTQSNGKQQFQIIYVGPSSAATGNVYLARVDLSDFLGQWVEVEERITFGTFGSYETKITRISDGRELVAVDRETRNMWRDGTTGMRPKWGIYRSFGDGGSEKGNLRDEILKFADFSIEKVVE